MLYYEQGDLVGETTGLRSNSALMLYFELGVYPMIIVGLL